MKGILSKINELYGITASSPEKVARGFLSENYILSDGATKFFLKKYRFDSAKRIAEIHVSKRYFADGGIPVILPIPLLDGATFFEHETAYYALFPFINGKHLERGTLSDVAIDSLGTTLGRIHLLGKESRLVIDDYFKIEDEGKTFLKIEGILERITEKDSLDDFDRIALENIEMKKRLLLTNARTSEDLQLLCDHLIHGDYLDQNVFFTTDQKIEYVFDFEKTCYAPRTYELFRSMIYGLWTGRVTETDLMSSKRYLQAYISIYPMTPDEIRKGLQLFLLKAIHGFWVESEHYLKNSTRADAFLLDDYTRIKYLSENLEPLANFLTE